MKLTDESKFFMGILAASIAILVIAALILSQPVKQITYAKELLITPNTHTTGNPNAAVWLVEFSDFECPACGFYEPTIAKLRKTYPDALLFAYRHFPLPQHKEGFPAARVAEAAGTQGKFWDAHKKLFENQKNLSEDTYLAIAKDLSMDPEMFTLTRKTGSISAAIDADAAFGASIGINSTPTFFLNGKKLVITGPEELEKLVIEAINKKTNP